jgi:hypothetical protein
MTEASMTTGPPSIASMTFTWSSRSLAHSRGFTPPDARATIVNATNMACLPAW